MVENNTERPRSDQRIEEFIETQETDRARQSLKAIAVSLDKYFTFLTKYENGEELRFLMARQIATLEYIGLGIYFQSKGMVLGKDIEIKGNQIDHSYYQNLRGELESLLGKSIFPKEKEDE